MFNRSFVCVKVNNQGYQQVHHILTRLMSDKTVRITQELNSRKPQDQTAKADTEPAFRVSPDVSLSEK